MALLEVKVLARRTSAIPMNQPRPQVPTLCAGGGYGWHAVHASCGGSTSSARGRSRDLHLGAGRACGCAARLSEADEHRIKAVELGVLQGVHTHAYMAHGTAVPAWVTGY